MAGLTLWMMPSASRGAQTCSSSSSKGLHGSLVAAGSRGRASQEVWQRCRTAVAAQVSEPGIS
jgi:hypothetical protein